MSVLDNTDSQQQGHTTPQPRVVRDATVDWVKFDAELARDGSVDPVDKALYAALASFVPASTDQERITDPEGHDVPTRRVLAACIGRSLDTVDRATKRLEQRGLVEVERRKDPANPRSNVPSVYRLLDHERWDERAAERAARRRAQRSGGSRMDAARGSRTSAARGSRTSAAVPLSSEKTEEISLSEGASAQETAAETLTAVVAERESMAAPTNDNHQAQQPASIPSPRSQQPQTAALAPQPTQPAVGPQTAPVSAPQPSQAAQPAPAVPEAVQRVLDAYTAALGRPVLLGTRQRLAQQAVELLAANLPEAWLCDRAAEMAAAGKGWTDLARHVEHSTAPLPGAAPTSAAGSGLPPWCGTCGDGMPAQHNPRFRRTPDGALCHCHPDAVEQQRTRRGGHQPHRDPVDQSVYDLDFNGRPLPA